MARLLSFGCVVVQFMRAQGSELRDGGENRGKFSEHPDGDIDIMAIIRIIEQSGSYDANRGQQLMTIDGGQNAYQRE